ncbi:MAG: alpha/beta fold hydrolase [Acidobacteriota bacterium]
MRSPLRSWCLLVLSTFLLPAVVAARPYDAAPSTTTAETATVWTTLDGRSVNAFEGTVEVPEDPDDPTGSSLRLAYVKLPTTSARPASPIVYLAGGPGGSGIDTARGARADMLLALRAVGDVVLLDQRGTGRSSPTLVCGKTWSHPADRPLDQAEVDASILDAATLCRQQMDRRGIRLAHYGPRAIAYDVDALRRALGSERISLVATSFGTRVALEVLRRHGARVERAILLGVLGPEQVLKSPRRADEVLSRIEFDAERSLHDVLAARLEALEASATTTTAIDVLTGDEVQLGVGPLDLQLVITDHLAGAAELAMLRELAVSLERADLTPIASFILRQRKRWLGHVMPYSAICAASGPADRQQRIDREVETSVVGRQLNLTNRALCDALGLEPPAPASFEPVQSDVPVLLISGSLDARTPAGNAEQVARTLSRSHHVVVEGAGHSDDLWAASPRIAELAVRFLHGDAPDAERIDALAPWLRVPPPPGTEVVEVVDTLHDRQIVDPYRWLERSKTPETRVWAATQNRYTDRLLDVLPERGTRRGELRRLFAGTGTGLPRVRGDLAVYRRVTSSRSTPSLVVRHGDLSAPDGDERVLVSPAQVAAGDAPNTVSLDVEAMSADGQLVAFSIRRQGAAEVSIRFVETASGTLLDDELPTGLYFGIALAPHGGGAYYGREREDGEGSRVHYHRFGTDPADDPVVFGESYGRAAVVWPNPSDDGVYLVHHGVSGTTQQIDLALDRLDGADASAPLGHDVSQRRTVVQDVPSAFYGGVAGDRLVIHTTWEAPRGRIFTAPLDSPGQEHWREIVPEHEDAVIETVFAAGGKLLVEYLDDIRSRLVIFDLDGRRLGDVELPGIGSLERFSGHSDHPVVFFTFSSYHLPPTIFRYDIERDDLSVWRSAAPLLDPSSFVGRRLWAESKDGTRVPYFVVHRRDLEIDGARPTIISAYGGFATSLTPSYQPEIAWWVEQGGVWAVANVRGGGELGDTWHQAAVRETKQRSIDDLIAVAEALIESGHTRSERLATWGHSAGGLLVAAAGVQRPDLFRAVVSTHPLLDMLRYNKFLAARFWLPEYGSPDRADAFEHLVAYSPYHNVDPSAPQQPAYFFETSYGDTQVAPLHARKMTARMQALATPERPVVLRHHGDVGHGGEGVTAEHRLDELTDVLSFLLWQLDAL